MHCLWICNCLNFGIEIERGVREGTDEGLENLDFFSYAIFNRGCWDFWWKCFFLLIAADKQMKLCGWSGRRVKWLTKMPFYIFLTLLNALFSCTFLSAPFSFVSKIVNCQWSELILDNMLLKVTCKILLSPILVECPYTSFQKLFLRFTLWWRSGRNE